MSITGWFWTIVLASTSTLFWVAIVEWSPPAAAGYIAGTVATLTVVALMADPPTPVDAPTDVPHAGAHPTPSPRVGASIPSTGAATGPEAEPPVGTPVRSGDNGGRSSEGKGASTAAPF